MQFSFVAAQLLTKMTSALQKSECCSATSAAQCSKNCIATSVFACGMLLESAKPKAVSKWLRFQDGKFLEFLKLSLGILVFVCFGTRLGVSLAAPKGVSRQMDFEMASFLSFAKLAFLCLFVLVPIGFLQ